MAKKKNQFPKLHCKFHVERLGLSSDPFARLTSLLDQLSATELDGEKIDGMDLDLSDNFLMQISDSSLIEKFVSQLQSQKVEIGTLTIPQAEQSTKDPESERSIFLERIRQCCALGHQLRLSKVRSNGSIRFSIPGPLDVMIQEGAEPSRSLIDTLSQACDIAAEYDEVLALERSDPIGAKADWLRTFKILEGVDCPNLLGFGADLGRSILDLLGANSSKESDSWDDSFFENAYRRMTSKLRPWTVDLLIVPYDPTEFNQFKVSFSDGLKKFWDAVTLAGFWLKDEDGLLKRFNHFGCRGFDFESEKPDWLTPLSLLSSVRQKYGWK